MDTNTACPCGGRYECRWVTARMTAEDRLAVFENVPRLDCRKCGSQAYILSVLQGLECEFRGIDRVVKARR